MAPNTGVPRRTEANKAVPEFLRQSRRLAERNSEPKENDGNPEVDESKRRTEGGIALENSSVQKDGPEKAQTNQEGPPATSVRANLVKLWEKRSNDVIESTKLNPFSKNFDATLVKSKLSPEKPDYGKPLPGSLSEERAKRAQEWVDKEIERLIAVISENGKNNQVRLSCRPFLSPRLD